METFWKSSKMEQFNIYQSANSDKESIKKIFILRRTEFQTIMAALYQRSAITLLQHELILGRKGSGKSTLLKRIEIEIEEKLSKKYIPVNLAEEQASIYRLFDLWLEIIEVLKTRFSFQTLIKDYSEFDKEENYTKYLHQQIHEFCLLQKKQIVLLLDNFDRIIENFSDEGNSLFREILINYDDVIIIAASTRIDEPYWQLDKPFYEFFRQHHLEALSIDEIKKLLNHWAEAADIPELKMFIANNKGKLQSVRIITDGLPRTFQFFIQLIVQNDYASEGIDYLKKIMDNVTPLYQERLNNLPPQLRKIVLEMAFIWEACNTKQLVKKCKMRSKLISANLKTLSDKGIVNKIETDKRNLLYLISERFFNMWLIMTQGNSEQKQKAKWLNIFLENWYDATHLKNITQKNISEIRSLIEIQDYKKAIKFTKAIEDEDDGFIMFDLGTIDRIQSIYTEAEKYYLSAIEKGQVAAMYNIGNYYISKGKFEEAEKYYLLAIERGHINAIFNLGLLYASQGKFAEAKKYYLLAIEKGNINAIYNLGLLFASQGKFTEAKKYYLLAIGKEHVNAMYNLGNLFANQGKLAEAEKYYLMAVGKGHVNAIFNLGNLYANQDKLVEAEKYFLLAIEKGHIKAMCNLGSFYANQGKIAEAEKYFLLAMENEHVDAMYNLGNLYANKGKNAEAKKYYLLAIERGYVGAIYNLGLLFDNQSKFAEAEKYYLLAIEKNNNNIFHNLASLYYRQNKNKEDSLEYIRKYERNEALQIIIELWNGIFDDVEKRTLAVINESNTLNWFIIELLIHQQKALVLKMFNHSEIGQILQSRMKILHYVCLSLNQKTEDNLLLRIPPEVKTTIDEVINYIITKEKFYGYRE